MVYVWVLCCMGVFSPGVKHFGLKRTRITLNRSYALQGMDGGMLLEFHSFSVSDWALPNKECLNLKSELLKIYYHLSLVVIVQRPMDGNGRHV